MKRVTRVGLILALVAMAGCGGKQTGAQSAAGSGGGQEPGERSLAADDAPGDGLQAAAGARKQRVIPQAPQPAPDSLLATLVVGDPNAQLDALRQVVAQIEPSLAAVVHAGFFDQAIAELVGAPGISGLDYSQPVHVVILDPMVVSPPVLVVARVADEAALRGALGSQWPFEIFVDRGVVVLGAEPALDAAAGWALTTLVKEPAPVQPIATLYLGSFMAAHEQQITEMLPMAKAAMSQSMPPADAASALAAIDAFLAFARQIDRVTASLDATAAAVTLRMAALPVDQSALTGFIAKQKPATYAQLAALEPGAIVGVGAMDWKTLLEPMMSLMGNPYRAMYGDQADAILEMQNAWLEVMGEEFAMTGGYTPADGMWMAGAWEISDAKKVNTLIDQYGKKLPKKVGKPGAEFDFKVRRNAVRHAGVSLSEMRFAVAKGVQPEVRAAPEKIFGKGGMKILIGAFGKISAMAMGKDAGTRMKAAIDVVKGRKKGFAPSAELESALAQSRQLKESMLVAIDLASLGAAASGGPAVAVGAGGEPAVWALGFADGAIGMRVTVPLSQIKALIPAMTP